MPTTQTSTGIDLSIVIAIAALVLSALSPLISAFVNGKFRIKEKKLDITAKKQEQEREFYYRHRAEVIENYIRATGQVIEADAQKNQMDFGSAMGEIYLYVDRSLWPLLDRIADYIHNENGFKAKDDFIELCKTLSSENVRTQDMR